MGLLKTLFAGPPVQAAGTVAVATANRPTLAWGTGMERLAPFDWAPPTHIWSRDAAMAVPCIRRSRDLICGAIGALPLTSWTVRWDDATRQPFEEQTPPPRWMARPDPNATRQVILARTADDLMFYGAAYWRITGRLTSTYPQSFAQMPAADVHIDANGRITNRGAVVDPVDVVEFLSPLDPLLSVGWRAIQTALNLDSAAERFSLTEIPAGWLEQDPASEPLSPTELAEIATDFQTARQARTVAALNPYIRWKESAMDPSRLQLVEARQYQAVELARVANIPAYFLNAPAGTGMTYMNAQQAKQDLIDFGAMPYIGCIEQTLSGPNVTPAGQAVRLALNAWLRNPFTPNDGASPNDVEIAFNPDVEVPE